MKNRKTLKFWKVWNFNKIAQPKGKQLPETKESMKTGNFKLFEKSWFSRIAEISSKDKKQENLKFWKVWNSTKLSFGLP